VAAGNAISMFFNSLGAAIGLSIDSNIFSNRLVKEIPKYAPGVEPELVLNVSATGLSHLGAAPEILAGIKEAYDKALTTAFIIPIAVGGLCFFFSLLFEWKSVKGKKLSVGGPGA
jgi:hypothetical protein